MAELVALALGALLFGLGLWILLLRISGFYDFVHPNNMSIGRMTVDGTDNKVYAELLRARFDHHFRRPTPIPAVTGFLEAATLDTPELFQPQGVQGALQDVTLDVSGVDVTSVVKLVNKLAAPDEWVVEGDFQVRADRGLLALRLRRGARVIRTWYLERYKNAADAKSDEAATKAVLLEDLIDDAIFQLVYDFVNPSEKDRDLRKWREVIRNPPRFTSPAAVGALYKAQGALGSYYTRGDWHDLDVAVEHLRELQGLMPEFADGLRLLGMALAEKRAENEAIHVYEQLGLLLERRLHAAHGAAAEAEDLRRLMQVRLLKATTKCKLDTWSAAHEAIGELTRLADEIRAQLGSNLPAGEQAAYRELLGQTAAQLAYNYAVYLDYLSRSTIASVFGDEHAPPELRITDAETIRALGPESPPQKSMQIVRGVVQKVVHQYQVWLEEGWNQESELRQKALWRELQDHERRQTELVSRLRLASGYANVRMAEWERRGGAKEDSLFGETFESRLVQAKQELSAADAAHPNHYVLLRLLGLAYSEPRDKSADLSLAEHYLERALRAKPTDYTSQELRAAIMLRRIVNRGVDLTSREALQQGKKSMDDVIEQHEGSGAAHLLRAQFQTLLLEIEKDATRRQELRTALRQYFAQAGRFLPPALGMEDPDLAWLRVIDETRRLGEPADAASSGATAAPAAEEKQQQERFKQSKKELQGLVRTLIEHCTVLEDRWVNQRRVFEIQRIKASAGQLDLQIKNATLEKWRDIPIVFQ